MALQIDCAACPAKPRACGDCSVGFLLGPVVRSVPATVTDPPGTSGSAALGEAIAVFAGEGMLPGLRIVPEQGRKAV